MGLPPAAAGGQGEGQAVFAELDRRYRERQRHYHGWAHIEACLAELESVRDLSPHPGALELAIWFHDAVYEPGAADNEQRSAALLRAAAVRLGLPAALVAEAEELILVTRHLGGEPSALPLCRADTELMLDIDLAIFGQPWEAFAAYEEGIRREYRVIPEQLRRQRRKAVLQHFLDRPRIYLTEGFFQRYELKARDNLRRSVTRLG